MAKAKQHFAMTVANAVAMAARHAATAASEAGSISACDCLLVAAQLADQAAEPPAKAARTEEPVELSPFFLQTRRGS